MWDGSFLQEKWYYCVQVKRAFSHEYGSYVDHDLVARYALWPSYSEAKPTLCQFATTRPIACVSHKIKPPVLAADVRLSGCHLQYVPPGYALLCGIKSTSRKGELQLIERDGEIRIGS